VKNYLKNGRVVNLLFVKVDIMVVLISIHVEKAVIHGFVQMDLQPSPEHDDQSAHLAQEQAKEIKC
jgi:hypothetical protein